MNPTASSNPTQPIVYRTDAQRFFSRYPAVLFALLFPSLFTLFSIMDVLNNSAASTVVYSHQVWVVALRAGVVSVTLFLFQLWRWRQSVPTRKPNV